MFIFYDWGGVGEETIAFQKERLCQTEGSQDLESLQAFNFILCHNIDCCENLPLEGVQSSINLAIFSNPSLPKGGQNLDQLLNGNLKVISFPVQGIHHIRYLPQPSVLSRERQKLFVLALITSG